MAVRLNLAAIFFIIQAHYYEIVPSQSYPDFRAHYLYLPHD